MNPGEARQFHQKKKKKEKRSEIAKGDQMKIIKITITVIEAIREHEKRFTLPNSNDLFAVEI